MNYSDFENVTYCQHFTEKKLSAIETLIKDMQTDDFCVVVNGSFARFEAHPESDFDYFVLTTPGVTEQRLKTVNADVGSIVEKIVGKFPSTGGAFAQSMEAESIATTIGGNDDSNKDITRRILFLTEGRPLGNREIYLNVRTRLLQRYIKPTITNHQLGLFLLNDIIRYYRTICVDFEQKTFEQGKPWGIRNVKLVFSRKLLYFGGILLAAEMADKTYSAKVKTVENLIELAPIDRINKVCGRDAFRAIESYDYFLGEIKKLDVRTRLADVTDDRTTHTNEFKDLKNAGKKFTDQLMTALAATYPQGHPIHRSLIM